ncbi:unnamed protein product, partial [Ixodes pacificus]
VAKLENCQKCGKDSLDVWMANQCLRMICNKCLVQEYSIDDCNHCNAATQKFWCPGQKYGCKFQKTILDTKEPVKTCGFVPVSCTTNATKPRPRSSSTITCFECRLNITECQFCGQGCYALKLTAHLEVCEEALVSCNYCHEDNIRRRFLPVHARDCGKTPVTCIPCPMKKHGWIFEAVEAEIEEHLNFRNHVSCFDDMHERIQELELMNTIERSHQRVQGTKLETNQPAVIGCVSLFDKELLWVVKLPE